MRGARLIVGDERQRMRIWRRLAAACVVMACLSLVTPGLTAAKASSDISGSWSCCGAGGAAAQTWKITMSPSGTLSGSGGGSPYTYPITGKVTGTSVTLTTGPYTQLPSYSATFTGTISANGRTMTGNWTSNQSQSGTWTATRTSAPPHSGKKCVVPKLAGHTLAAAKTALKAAHCGIGKVSFKPSGKVPKGQMLSWKPGTGSKHPAGTKIALTVSSGSMPKTKMCVVPRLKGRSLAAAKTALKAAHCGIGKVSFKPSGKVPKGQMLSWKPGTGSKHPAGTKIALTVSRGKH